MRETAHIAFYQKNIKLNMIENIKTHQKATFF